MSTTPECFVFDNGSLRAASTLGLRRVAEALAGRLGQRVRAVSLLHSSGVDQSELGGQPAELLEPALAKALAAGLRSAVLVPLFFGPSAALTDYLPQRIRALLRAFPTADIRLARWLVDVSAGHDRRIAEAMAVRARERMAANRLSFPQVILVDHGSPQPGVGAVRDFLARQLRVELAGQVPDVWPASMERRPGDAYAFNEPLLAYRLRLAPCNAGDVVVALQFLSPGRHAGPGGDIATICDEAEAAQPGLKIHLAEPLGAEPRVVDVLAERFYEAARDEFMER